MSMQSFRSLFPRGAERAGTWSVVHDTDKSQIGAHPLLLLPHGEFTCSFLGHGGCLGLMERPQGFREFLDESKGIRVSQWLLATT